VSCDWIKSKPNKQVNHSPCQTELIWSVMGPILISNICDRQTHRQTDLSLILTACSTPGVSVGVLTYTSLHNLWERNLLSRVICRIYHVATQHHQLQHLLYTQSCYTSHTSLTIVDCWMLKQDFYNPHVHPSSLFLSQWLILLPLLLRKFLGRPFELSKWDSLQCFGWSQSP